MSPFLFNLAADTLAKMIHMAQRNEMVSSLVPHLIQNRIADQQYADDTILFMDGNKNNAVNMKLLLFSYETFVVFL